MVNYIKIWKEVFLNWKYSLIAIVIAFIFYSLNVLISGYRNLIGLYSDLGAFGSLQFFFGLLIGFKDTILTSSFYSLVIISVLFGILISLIFYKSQLIHYSENKNVGVLSSIGLFLAAFAPGCAACGVGLAAALGLGAGFLSFLPYKGLELSVIAILILGYSIVKISDNMYTCNIKGNFKKSVKGGNEK